MGPTKRSFSQEAVYLPFSSGNAALPKLFWPTIRYFPQPNWVVSCENGTPTKAKTTLSAGLKITSFKCCGLVYLVIHLILIWAWMELIIGKKIVFWKILFLFCYILTVFMQLKLTSLMFKLRSQSLLRQIVSAGKSFSLSAGLVLFNLLHANISFCGELLYLWDMVIRVCPDWFHASFL